MVLYLSTNSRKWRNWQTRRIKDPVAYLGCAGSSPAFRIYLKSTCYLTGAFSLLKLKQKFSVRTLVKYI
jgi:hypothetical protein